MKELLEKYVGSTCEVKTLENDLLFLGKVRGVVDGTSLSLDIVSTDGSPLIGARYGVPVKLSLYKNAKNMMIVGGKVYMANGDFWRVSSISQYQNYERRGFFRIQAKANGFISKEGSDGGPPAEYRANLVNISLSGVLFSSPVRFNEKDTVTLSGVCLGDDKWPFTFNVEVVAADEETPAGILHRGHFLEMEQKESDRLCKAIFALQREYIKKRKGRF